MSDEDIIGFHRRLPPFKENEWTGAAFRFLYKDTTCPIQSLSLFLALNRPSWKRPQRST
jgi:hypothetical protein